jgi:hypothetical protein
MTKLKVHLLNFHGIFSHSEIVLENTSTKPHSYYGINRWENPKSKWGKEAKVYIEEASSTYSFDIEADPQKIVVEWNKYWKETQSEASILGKNCAVAAQWFLTKYANIPEPNFSNVSVNHLIGPIFWPSIIPCPVTTGGRVMSNAKFHIEARNHPEIANQYSRLFLYASMSLAALVFAASVLALSVASTVLTGGIATAMIATGVIGTLGSSYGFFKAANILSAKNIADTLNPVDDPHSLRQEEINDLSSLGATI